MKKPFYRTSLAMLGLIGTAEHLPAAKVDFKTHIKPILESSCLSCHGEKKPKGDLRLDSLEMVLKGGEIGTALVPGEPDKSPLYTLTILPADDDDIMPPKGAVLSKDQTEALKQWIAQGAPWPEGIVLKKTRRVDFVRDIKPILENACLNCHRESHDKGDLRLDERDFAFQGGENGPAIVPFEPKNSPFYTLTILPADHDDLMPPSNKGGPLPKDQLDFLRDWIVQGANWPEGIKLAPVRRDTEDEPTPSAVGIAAAPKTTRDIHAKVVDKLIALLEPGMKPYTETLPGSGTSFEVIPIPSGEFEMGSPDSEKGRKPDESPRHKVKIAPFWMSKCEVTWNAYELFMYPEEEKMVMELRGYKSELNAVSDAVARPTTPYVEMSFGMGKDGFPAISMTQHAANKYCEWLTAKTGHYYRLPTEAEWEFACRAGTTTAYHFGNDPSQLSDYAWHAGNSNFKYQKVGTKKPNPWGLHDMHGNVAEWTLDKYVPNYGELLPNVASNPFLYGTNLYPRVIRGGSWDDTPEELRSAVRRFSTPDWKEQDPQLPKSIWYHTDAQFLGFRVIRPLIVPSAEKMHKYWTTEGEKD